MEVGGPEIVAPLTDTVCFIDGDETDVHAPELNLENLGSKSFGGDIEQLGATKNSVVERGDNLVARHARVDGGSLNATSSQVGYLVFHEGDERRDDDTGALLCECRNLKGYRLPTTSWHQPEGVVTAADALDNLALNAAKIIVAKMLMKY